MFEEINKLDDKYIVIKRADVNEILEKQDIVMLNHFLKQISLVRKHQGKKDNSYVVLNLDDVFASNYLNTKWVEFIWHRLNGKFDGEKNEWKEGPFEPPIIRDIAPMLVNSILSAKAQGLDKRRHG